MSRRYRQVTIIGIGLMGGSLGLAVKKRGLADKVIGVGRNAQRLKIAGDKGAIDSFTLSIKEGCAEADLVVLGLPVDLIIESLQAVAQSAPEEAVITDLGSTKATIVAAAQKWFKGKPMFVGSHPMAGSEKSGVEFARPDLYEGATCFITPDSETPRQGVVRVTEFWQALGTRPIIVSPEQHDYLVSVCSHLPRVVTAGLCAILTQADMDENFLKLIIGPGFRDTTRIAQSDPQLWLDIIKHNKQNILNQIDNLNSWLEEISTAISRGDEEKIRSLLEAARTFRQHLNP